MYIYVYSQFLIRSLKVENCFVTNSYISQLDVKFTLRHDKHLSREIIWKGNKCHLK